MSGDHAIYRRLVRLYPRDFRDAYGDDLVQHFGLGPACEATVTIRWPVAGLPEETFTVLAGHRYRIEEGSGEPTLEDP